MAVVLAVGVGSGLVAGCSSSESGAGGNIKFVTVKPGYSEIPLSKRQAAPTLDGKTLTGSSFALSQLTGKVVVVNFWGSWCAPCRAESAALQTVATATAANGVSFVGVNERDSRTDALSFVNGHDVTYPSVFDSDGSLAAQWPAAAGPPYTFIVDRKGRIAARFLGGVTAADLKAAVTKVTSEA